MAQFEHLQELVVGLYDRGISKPPADRILNIGTSKILKSGIWSPYLVNARPALSFDHGIEMPVVAQERVRKLMLQAVCAEVDEANAERPFAHVFGSPEAGTPLASAVAAEGGYSVLWQRVIAKPGYGSHQLLEGVTYPGENVLQIDDVITSGDTKRESDAFLREVELGSTDVVVVVNREQGGAESIAQSGMHLRSAIGASALFECLHDGGRISTTEFDFLLAYTNGPLIYEEPADHPWN